MGREIDECAAWLGPTLIADLQHPCVVPGRATRPSLHPVAGSIHPPIIAVNTLCRFDHSLFTRTHRRTH